MINSFNARISPTPNMVYTEELSFLGVLKSLISKLNEVINEINNIELSWQEYVQAENAKLKAELLAYINSEISRIDAKYSAEINRLLNIINDFKIQNATEHAEIYRHISNAVATINQQIENLRIYLDNRLDAMTDLLLGRISDEVQKIVASGWLINDPVTRTKVRFEKAVHNLYKYRERSPYAITVGEFEQLNLTIDQFKAQILTTDMFATRGYYFLIDKNHREISPVSGKLQDIRLTFDELTNFHRDFITVDDFLIPALTIDDFKSLSITITAFVFDASNAWPY